MARKGLAVVGGVIVVVCVLGFPLAMVLGARGRRDGPSIMEEHVPTGTQTDAAPTTSAALTVEASAVDDRVARFARLVGTSKQHVVETLGPPSDYIYISDTYTYRTSDVLAHFQFYDPERNQSTFSSQTRGGAATVLGLSLQFDTALNLSLPVVVRSAGASSPPTYLLVDRYGMSAQILNHLANQGFAVAIGGRRDDGLGYEVLARCTEPPLTGPEVFDYATNRMDIPTMARNARFQWTQCTPLGVRLTAGTDWTVYELRFYDDNLGAHGLRERIEIGGAGGR